MLNFDYLRKCLAIVSPPHVVHNFNVKLESIFKELSVVENCLRPESAPFSYFQANIPLSYLLKTTENLWFPDVFKGYRGQALKRVNFSLISWIFHACTCPLEITLFTNTVPQTKAFVGSKGVFKILSNI